MNATLMRNYEDISENRTLLGIVVAVADGLTALMLHAKKVYFCGVVPMVHNIMLMCRCLVGRCCQLMQL